MRPLLVSEPDVITIPDPDQPTQQQLQQQQATEVVTISDEDEDDSFRPSTLIFKNKGFFKGFGF